MKKILFSVLFALVGVQNSFALNCEGKIHVQIPDSWSTPYIMVDGTKTVLPANSKVNGWYVLDALKYGGQYAQKFLFMKGDFYDPGITTKDYNVNGGIDGWSQMDAFTCDILATGDVYIYEHPAVPGKTVVSSNPPDAKYFFVMIPPEMEDWMSSVPMISLDGGQTGKPMTAVGDMCGWYSYVFFNEEITDDVVLFRDDDLDREDMIGVNGNWETSAKAQPIPLGMIFNMGIDSLFFVPDEEQKTNADGYYYSAAEVEGIEGVCSYTMAAIIYDTDAELHPFFSCYSPGGEGCQMGAQDVSRQEAAEYINACIGVYQGLVESNLDPATKKPTLSTKGKKCFKDAKYFNQMFTYTENVNEKSCFDMPFHRSQDGKWEFDSDFYHSPGANGPGGFYPAEQNDDAIILAADPSQKPIEQARHKRVAEGPVFYGPAFREIDPDEGAPKIDILCNGPGWNKGIDCEGMFSTGSDEEFAFAVDFVGGNASTCVLGWSCPQSAPTGWHYFKEGTDTEVDPNSSYASYRWTADRNQHYCFESHAKFTHKPGLSFSFRGDDDIWVFVDNKLAVDIGGTHLAAPGYVDLDNFTGASGKLEVGNQYDLDIFFCDRRTTMSNVRIKTNMYIQQKSAINVRGTKNKNNPAETSYQVCYTKSGDGSCASTMAGENNEVIICDTGIVDVGLPISYTLVQGNSVSSPAVPGFENVSTPGVYKCGVDLTNLASPKVDKDKMCLGGGRYTLFMNIDGKSKKVATFRISGEVDVVYANAVAKDTNGVEIPGGKFTPKTSALAGEMVPVYISSVAPGEAVASGLEVFPVDAVGVAYTLNYDKSTNVYAKTVDPATGTESFVKLTSGQPLMIGPSGVDTVYVTVSAEDMTSALKTVSIGVSGRANVLTINFCLAQITFVEKIPGAGENAKAVQGMVPNADGTYDELWTGSIYDLYLAVLKPNADGTYSPCMEECNGLTIHKGVGTSPKIDFIPEEVTFENGFATISIRSLTNYRWDTDPAINQPATIVAEYNDYIQAKYAPVYFRAAPVQVPVFADVFDVRGTLSSKELAIPEPYFSMEKEYLDGIADSVAVYYDRPLHKDSLPAKLCILWDSASAEKHDPYKEGFSNVPKDTAISCNELISVGAKNVDCSDGEYCSNKITVGGLKLSNGVKTAGVGKVYSYSSFEDKGKNVKQGFGASLIDRVAPVLVQASVNKLEKGNLSFNSLEIQLSEPVQLLALENANVGLDFYLNSAGKKSGYASAVEKTANVVTAAIEPSIVTENGKTYIRSMYRTKDLSPAAGDYVRLSGNLANVIWSDVADISSASAESLRSNEDAGYYWNAPTGYDETKRLPSPWVLVLKSEDVGGDNGEGGEGKDIRSDEDEIFADPSFRVKMVGPFQFAIVMDESVPATVKSYAVMDLQGRVVKKGKITSSETVVPALSKGSYVVKVGLGFRHVNLH